MSDEIEPIFQSIFGDDWNQLPPVLKQHYGNHPYSDNKVVMRGRLDIKLNWLGKLYRPIFKMFRIFTPYEGKDIETIVHCTSNERNSILYFDRVFYFPNKEPYHFKSKMMQTRNNEIVEIIRFGLGWRINYVYENNLVKLKHLGYVIRILGLNIPIPLSFIIGKGYVEEKAIPNNSFEIVMRMTHPLFGVIYEYKGTFIL